MSPNFESKFGLSPNDPSFFEIVPSPNAPALGSVSLTPVSIWYWSAPPNITTWWIVKGIGSDSCNIFSWHKSENITKKKVTYKLSVDSSFTFTCYARLCALSLLHRLRCLTVPDLTKRAQQNKFQWFQNVESRKKKSPLPSPCATFPFPFSTFFFFFGGGRVGMGPSFTEGPVSSCWHCRLLNLPLVLN